MEQVDLEAEPLADPQGMLPAEADVVILLVGQLGQIARSGRRRGGELALGQDTGLLDHVAEAGGRLDITGSCCRGTLP